MSARTGAGVRARVGARLGARVGARLGARTGTRTNSRTGMRMGARLNALGLRWKIAALLASGCALVALAIGGLIHHARYEQVADQARANATAELIRVRKVYVATGSVDHEDSAAAIDSPDLPAPLRTAALAQRRTTYLELDAEHPVVWAARPIGEKSVLSVQLPLDEARQELADLDSQLLAWGTVVVALAALGGAAVASRVSRDLRTAAATARRISGGDLDARINHPRPPRTKNEVAELACAVDTMAATLQQRLEAEQRFTADVAHELRTPLTGLHTAAELLPPGRPTELVRDRVSALRVLTEDLLEVARLDARIEQPDLEVHPLGALVAQILRRAGLAAEFTGGSDTLVRTDARRLERILANLIVNARRHGSEPVEVHVADTSVTVRDHGPGFPAHLLAGGPQRFLTGAKERGQGTGLGLTIALGQAEVIGARVELSNADGGGARATVVLPEG
ncbi:sensor histidine kinase [Streptomyces indicus]|uniref:histidine kinase n=1 Tax=Streptomyces indicus TaxID=417292 RepID=A0A1G9D837_9ACTN|nr:HAMP domain-containing sensor histidine kinase [Streptomyces indicus]SDK59885.1 Signal transduction histidine kinase [Streptomyces indicus]